MRSKQDTYTKFYKTVILYAFSLYYVVKEFLNSLLFPKLIVGKSFMKSKGRVAIVTGGTSGIGLETTRLLLSFGVYVIIGSHVQDETTVRNIEKLQNSFPKSKVEVWHVDLSCLSSVKKFCERFLQTGMPLHLLINNAGIMFAPYEKTVDGFESHLGINYLSHCLLIKMLLPRLEQSGSQNCYSRIVNVSSCVHYIAEANMHGFSDQIPYCRYGSYMQSKLYQVMFTSSLNQYLCKGKSPVSVNAIHPGVCYTPLYKYVKWAALLLPYVLQKPSRGAEVAVFAALARDLERVGGKYIEECQIVRCSSEAQNEELRTRLWNKTWKVLKPWLDE